MYSLTIKLLNNIFKLIINILNYFYCQVLKDTYFDLKMYKS